MSGGTGSLPHAFRKRWCRSLSVHRVCAAILIVALAACSFKDPAEAKADAIRRGDELTDRQEHRRAVQAYREAIAIDPHDGAARMKLSRALRAAERWSEGAREGIAAADLLPDDLEAQVWGVSMMLAESRFIDAHERLTTLLERYPRHAQLFVLLGNTKAKLIDSTWVLWRMDQMLRDDVNIDLARITLRSDVPAAVDREAEAAYRHALELDPDSMEAQLAFANFLWIVGRADESEPLLKKVAAENPTHWLVNGAIGRLYLRAGRPAEAEKYLKAAEAIGDRDARFALADAYFALNRSAEALSILNELAADNDAGGNATLRAADIERHLGRRDAAQQRLDALLTREPRNAGALRRRAEILLEIGEIAPALAAARAAVETDATSAQVRYVFGRALAETGDIKGAFDQMNDAVRLFPNSKQASGELARLALALGRNDVAVEFARKTVRMAPDDRDANADLVRALLRTGNLSEAETALAPLLARDPRSADLLVLSGAIHGARGRTSAARTAYLRALDADRDSFDALSSLVALDLEAARLDDARARIDEALRTHPDSPRHLLLSAQVSIAARNLQQAETALRKALTAAPADAAAALLLADLLGQQQRRDEALRVLEQGLVQRPSAAELQIALADVLDALGRTADARTRYQATLVEHPNAATASAKLAALHVREGDNLEVALTLARAAKQQLPDDPDVSATLGWVYVRRNLPALGLPHLQYAVRAEPTNPLYRYQLGLAYLGARQTQRAREELTRALELDPASPYAGEARSALASVTR